MMMSYPRVLSTTTSSQVNAHIWNQYYVLLLLYTINLPAVGFLLFVGAMMVVIAVGRCRIIVGVCHGNGWRSPQHSGCAQGRLHHRRWRLRWHRRRWPNRRRRKRLIGHHHLWHLHRVWHEEVLVLNAAHVYYVTVRRLGKTIWYESIVKPRHRNIIIINK